MKILYMDLGMGAEKEKLCAALYDLLPDDEREKVVRTIEELGLGGVSVKAGRADESGKADTKASQFSILVNGKSEAEHRQAHDNGSHHHSHVHRSMKDIRDLVNGLSGVSDEVKVDILGIYDIVAAAEAEVHGSTPEDVHFHEVGGMYAIATVASYCILMNEIIDSLCDGEVRVEASPVRTGRGMIECAHGLLPVPAPATAAIIRDIPVFEGDIDAELTTPTGAAMARYYVNEFREQPAMEIEKSGCGLGVKGLGSKDNVTVLLGELR